jgi:hypothetical protein
MMSSKEIMISAYFTRQGFVSIEALPKTEQFNSVFFTEKILLKFVQLENLFCPKMQIHAYLLHIDNGTFHNSPLSLHSTKQLDSPDCHCHSIPMI